MIGLGVIILVITVVVAFIWFNIEFKRMKHKLYAMGLITLIIFLSGSLILTLYGKDIDYTNISGLIEAGGVYLSWLKTVGDNIWTITANAIKLDWGI
jgi:hypothetical protein